MHYTKGTNIYYPSSSETEITCISLEQKIQYVFVDLFKDDYIKLVHVIFLTGLRLVINLVSLPNVIRTTTKPVTRIKIIFYQ